MSTYSKEQKAAFAAKYRDPRWQKKRLKILERDEFTCFFCGDRESTLNVHHLAYTAADPWDTEGRHLLTLCEKCHEQETEQLYPALRRLSQAVRQFGLASSEIEALAAAFECSRPVHIPEVVAAAISYALQDDSEQRGLLDRYFAHIHVVYGKR